MTIDVLVKVGCYEYITTAESTKQAYDEAASIFPHEFPPRVINLTAKWEQEKDGNDGEE